MPEENQDDQIESEMLRMMQEEAEGETQDEAGEGAGTDNDAEVEMLKAMQDEMVAAEGGEEGGALDAEADLEAQMLGAMMDETGASDGADATALQQAVLLSADASSMVGGGGLDINLSVTIELGNTQVPIQIVLEWTEGSLIELDKVSGEAIDILINTKPIARGEVVTVGENFGVRITQLLPTIPSG